MCWCYVMAVCVGYLRSFYVLCSGLVVWVGVRCWLFVLVLRVGVMCVVSVLVVGVGFLFWL